jgi:death-on-curing protein
MTNIITVEQIQTLHTYLVNKTGGSEGIRDFGLLESAVQSTYQTFDNIEIYPSVQEKAGRMAFNIINNHPFVDGNKRIGVLSMLVFLEYNNVSVYFSQNELVELGVGIADSSIGYDDIMKWIYNHK